MHVLLNILVYADIGVTIVGSGTGNLIALVISPTLENPYVKNKQFYVHPGSHRRPAYA